MDTVRWQRIAQALARQGHSVDIVLNRASGTFPLAENLRYVSSGSIHWGDYDVVKTTFHRGFDFLESIGGAGHPFIISKLGSVVGASDENEGVYFFGDVRQRLYETQKRIATRSRYVTVLTSENGELWANEHGQKEKLLKVPTGVDRELPEARFNPFEGKKHKTAVYIGNLYDQNSQPITNRLWQLRLNSIGSLLQAEDINLVVIGPGDGSLLAPESVRFLGPVANQYIYDYMRNADAGLVLAQGAVQHNESSKLYELIRCGVPVVSEAPVPNNHLLVESRSGKIAEYGNDQQIAQMIATVIRAPTNYSHAVQYMLKHHTWDHRAAQYDALFR